MRPTDLHYRSIKERTPEPGVIPVVTRDGTPLWGTASTSYFSRNKTMNEGTQSKAAFGAICERFTDLGKTSSNRNDIVSPCSYDPLSSYNKIQQKPCPVRLTHLSVGKALSKTGDFHLEGSRLIYEPHYRDPRKKDPSFYKNVICKLLATQHDKPFNRKRSTVSVEGTSNKPLKQALTSPQKITSLQVAKNRQTLSPKKEQLQKTIDNTKLAQNNPAEPSRAQTPISYTKRCRSVQRTRRPQSQLRNHYETIPANLMVFMGSTINMDTHDTRLLNNFSTFQSTSTYSNKKSQRSTYRVLASDSNKASGYFQKSFMLPTDSSTKQRNKPIAYDLESRTEYTNGPRTLLEYRKKFIQRKQGVDVTYDQNRQLINIRCGAPGMMLNTNSQMEFSHTGSRPLSQMDAGTLSSNKSSAPNQRYDTDAQLADQDISRPFASHLKTPSTATQQNQAKPLISSPNHQKQSLSQYDAKPYVTPDLAKYEPEQPVGNAAEDEDEEEYYYSEYEEAPAKVQ